MGCGNAGVVRRFAPARLQFCRNSRCRKPASVMGGLGWKAKAGQALKKGILLTEGRETIGTSPIDASPQVILKMPDDSFTPFFVGLFVSLAFVGMLLQWWIFTGVMTLLHAWSH